MTVHFIYSVFCIDLKKKVNVWKTNDEEQGSSLSVYNNIAQ